MSGELHADEALPENLERHAGVDIKLEEEMGRPAEQRVEADPSLAARRTDLGDQLDVGAELQRVRGDGEIPVGVERDEERGREIDRDATQPTELRRRGVMRVEPA